MFAYGTNEIDAGKTLQMLVSLSEDNTLRKEILWSFDNESVAVVDEKGNEIGSDTQTMTSKAGFFQKIIAFFKKLFGMTKVIPEAFKGLF